MSAPLFPWDANNGAINGAVAPAVSAGPGPLKLGAPINGPAPMGAAPPAAGPNAAVNPPQRSMMQARPAVNQNGQLVRSTQPPAASTAGTPAAAAANTAMTMGAPYANNTGSAMMPGGAYGSGGMMGGAYGSTSGMMGGGMYGGGMYGTGMSSMYGGGMMGGGMMGTMGGAMGGMGGPAGGGAAAAAAVGPDGRPIAPVAKLQGWAIFAELASRLVQVIMHMARSGHEVFSVVAGSYWAFTSIRAMLGVGGAAPMHPLIQQQQQALAIKNGATPQAAASMVAAKAAASTAAATTTTAASATGNPPSSGRRTALLFGLFMVVATMAEFLYRRHQEKKKQRELEAAHRKLLGQHSVTAAATTAAAVTASDATATSAASTRCVAIHDFAGEGDGQLAFRCGDQLEVKEFDPNGWCFAASTGVAREERDAGTAAAAENPLAVVSGWVPGNFLRPLIQHRKL